MISFSRMMDLRSAFLLHHTVSRFDDRVALF